MKDLSKVICIFLFLTNYSFSQVKVSNKNFRSLKEVFVIDSTEDNKKFELASNSEGEFRVRAYQKLEVQKASKINAELASKLDDEFVKEFINMKYLNAGVECENGVYQLFMRGEKFVVCKENKPNIIKVKNFIIRLEKIFS